MTPERRRMRNRLLVVAILPALLLLLASARATLLLVDQADAQAAYRTGAFTTARDEFARNRVLNPVDRWVAPFGEGVARYRAGDHPGAVAAYGMALEHAPTEWECAVRNNLALAHEAIGDAFDTDEQEEDAEAAWAEGREVLAGCLALVPDPSDSEALREDLGVSGTDPLDPDEVTPRQRSDRRTARGIDDRLAAKLDEDERRRTTRPADPQRRDETFDERRQRLEERSQRALERRNRQEQQREDYRNNRPDELAEPTPVPQW